MLDRDENIREGRFILTYTFWDFSSLPTGSTGFKSMEKEELQ